MDLEVYNIYILGIDIDENNYKDFIKQFPIPDEDGEPTDKRLSEDISFEEFFNTVKDAVESGIEYENFFYFEYPDETFFIIFGYSLCEWSSKQLPQIVKLDFNYPSKKEMDIFNCTEEKPEIYTWSEIK